MRADDPNLPILSIVASALGALCEDVVFVGGCAAGLLLTDPAAAGIRPTLDVDAIVEATTLSRFYAVESALPPRGFVRDTESEVICRWRHRASGVTFDLMPTDPSVLGFANRWYPEAIRTAQQIALTHDLKIRLISAPVFLATKLEAFATRGRHDLFSHDLEDILLVLDGREALLAEINDTSSALQDAVRTQIRALLQRPDFENTLPGLIAESGRAALVLRRLKALAN